MFRYTIIAVALVFPSLLQAFQLSIRSISDDNILDFTFDVSYLQRDALRYIDYIPDDILERLQNLIDYSSSQQSAGVQIPSDEMILEANQLMAALEGIEVPDEQEAAIDLQTDETDTIVIQDSWQQTDIPNYYAPQSGTSLDQSLANLATTNLQNPFGNSYTNNMANQPMMRDPQSYTGMNYFNDPNFYQNTGNRAYDNMLSWLNNKQAPQTNNAGGLPQSDLDAVGLALADLDFQNAMVISRGGSTDGQQDTGMGGGFSSPRAANIDIIDMANTFQTPPRTEGTSMQISPDSAMQISPDGQMQISPPQAQNNANVATVTETSMTTEEEQKTDTVNTGASNPYLVGTRGWPNTLAAYNLPNAGGQGGSQNTRTRRSRDTNDYPPSVNGKRGSPFIG
ncbi:hypothetical protein TWF696_003793 [Orbilia brochopaga]|uniref:Secreted protein n=1 Tax=Orbilia brochopaga TaxID=3140254 RepID=A0AAV9V5V6_9PEZI